MSIIAWIVLGLGAGYESGTPVLVRAEKRLYQDAGRQLPASSDRLV